MIDYEKYAEIRDSKGFTDGKVAQLCGFGRSTFTDWKNHRSVPKIDKVQKIADLFGMDYFEFVGPVGKFSSLNPNRPIPMLAGMEKTPEQRFDENLLRLYHNATSDAQKSVMTLLENSQKDSLKSSKEA